MRLIFCQSTFFAAVSLVVDESQALNALSDRVGGVALTSKEREKMKGYRVGV